MPDLLDRIRSELDDRVAELKPAADELARLQRAADALDGAMASHAAAPAASRTRSATRRRAKPARRGGSAGQRKVAGRAAPGETQLRVIQQLRDTPGSSSTAVAQALGISANAAAATISRLVKQNRVNRLTTGGYESAATQPADPASPETQAPGTGSGSGST